MTSPIDGQATTLDRIAPDAEAGIVGHMNHDHADALRTIVDAFLDVDGEVIEARMLSCHRYGFEVQLALAPDQPDAVGGLAFGRLGFEPPLTAAKQARQAMGDLVSAARRIRT